MKKEKIINTINEGLNLDEFNGKSDNDKANEYDERLYFNFVDLIVYD